VDDSLSDLREREKVVRRRVSSFLQDRGYPEDSIVPEPAIRSSSDGRVFRPDFVIVDPDKNERLVIVEVKPKLNKRSKYNIVDQLLAYTHVLGGLTTDTYLITGSDDDSLEFYRLTEEGELDQFEKSEFPRFNAVRANRLASEKDKVEEERSEATDDFKVTCWIIAGVGILVTVADFVLSFWNIVLLTGQRLAVMAVSVGVLIIPYAAKLKALGIEWERYSD
jgi:hypothetical protein